MKIGPRWLIWFLGLALLAGVIVIALHFAEAGEFLRVVQRAQPIWLLLAIALQAVTYPAQAAVWQLVARASKGRLSFGDACRISVAKQFVDQALPSAGLTGTVFVAGALDAQGMSRGAAWAAVAINLISYNTVYVLGIALALSLGVLRGRGSSAIILISAIFTVLTAGITLLMFFLPGRKSHPLSRRIGKVPMVHGILQHLESADVRLVRHLGILSIAAICQIAIIVLDTFTLVALIESLGTSARIAGAFAVFMIASLVRSMGFVPGGLGTFEAASVLSLRLTGARLSVALGATLMFRVLSFWLPMFPGLWYSRQLAPSVKVQK